MTHNIDCFLPCADPKALMPTVHELAQSACVGNIYLLVPRNFVATEPLGDCKLLAIDGLTSAKKPRRSAWGCMP